MAERRLDVILSADAGNFISTFAQAEKQFANLQSRLPKMIAGVKALDQSMAQAAKSINQFNAANMSNRQLSARSKQLERLNAAVAGSVGAHKQAAQAQIAADRQRIRSTQDVTRRHEQMVKAQTRATLAEITRQVKERARVQQQNERFITSQLTSGQRLQQQFMRLGAAERKRFVDAAHGAAILENNVRNARRESQLFYGHLGDYGGFVGFQMLGRHALFASGAIAAAMGLSVKAFVDFEDAFAGVRKTVDGSEAEFQALEQQIREMATTIPIAATELAKIAAIGGQLGLPNQALAEFTDTVAKLGVATNVTAEEAATFVARIANVMKIDHSQFDQMGAAVTDLGNRFPATEQEIFKFSNRIAATGAVAKMSVADIFGISTAFASVGVPAERGGTAVQKAIFAINDAVTQGTPKLEKFAEVAKGSLSGEEFAALWRESPAEGFALFIEGLGEIVEQGGSVSEVLTDLIAGDVRLAQSFASVAAAGDLVTRSIETSNRAFEENAALEEESAKRFETLASQLQILRNRVTETGIALGEQLAPAAATVLTAIVDLIEGFGDLPEPIQRVILGFGGLSAALLALGGTWALAHFPARVFIGLLQGLAKGNHGAALTRIGVAAANAGGGFASLRAASAAALIPLGKFLLIAGLIYGAWEGFQWVVRQGRDEVLDFNDAINNAVESVDMTRKAIDRFGETPVEIGFEAQNQELIDTLSMMDEARARSTVASIILDMKMHGAEPEEIEDFFGQLREVTFRDWTIGINITGSPEQLMGNILEDVENLRRGLDTPWHFFRHDENVRLGQIAEQLGKLAVVDLSAAQEGMAALLDGLGDFGGRAEVAVTAMREIATSVIAGLTGSREAASGLGREFDQSVIRAFRDGVTEGELFEVMYREIGYALEEAGYIEAARHIQGIVSSTEEATEETVRFNGALGDTYETMEEAEDAAELYRKRIEDLAGVLDSAVDPVARWNESVDELVQAHKEAHAESDSVPDLATAWWDFQVDASAAMDAWQEKMAETIAAQENWEGNLAEIARRAGADVALRVAEWGPEMAPFIEEWVNAPQEEWQETLDLLVRDTELGGTAHAAAFDQYVRATAAVASEGFQGILDDVILRSGLTREQFITAIDNFGTDQERQWAKSQLIAAAGIDGVNREVLEGLEVGVRKAAKIAEEYAASIERGVIPVIRMVGGVPATVADMDTRTGELRHRGGLVARADGGFLPDQATIAYGTRVQWAEPETGGEAFIPLAPSKRQRSLAIWAETGKRLKAFAEGGFNSPDDVPKPPHIQWPGPVAGLANAAMDRVYGDAVDAIKKFGAVLLGGGDIAGGSGQIARMMEALRAVFPGLRLISGLRPGAITATGNRSYHSMGRAVDLPPNMSVFNWIASNYGANTKELIFTPAGRRQIRNGKPHVYRGVTARDHWNHIHWAMAKGGILNPHIRDGGGPLLPGYTFNGTGRPERVVPMANGGFTGRPSPEVDAAVVAAARQGDTSDLERRIRAIFENRAVSIANAWETENERLARLVHEVLAGRTLDSIRHSVDLIAAEMKRFTGVLPAARIETDPTIKAKYPVPIPRMTPEHLRPPTWLSREDRIAWNNNRFALGDMPIEEHLFNLEARIKAERMYSDEWTALVQERNRVLQEHYDEWAQKQREIQEQQQRLRDNERQWRYENMSAAEQLKDVEKRLKTVTRFSDEWMELERERKRLLADRKAEEDRVKAAKDQYNFERMTQAQQMKWLDDRIRKEKEFSEEWIRLTEQRNNMRLEERRSQEQLLGSLGGWTNQFEVGWVNSPGAIARNAEAQVKLIEEWADGLIALQRKGLHPGLFAVFGLNDPSSIGVIRSLLRATPQEISRLNAAFVRGSNAISRGTGTIDTIQTGYDNQVRGNPVSGGKQPKGVTPYVPPPVVRIPAEVIQIALSSNLHLDGRVVAQSTTDVQRKLDRQRRVQAGKSVWG